MNLKMKTAMMTNSISLAEQNNTLINSVNVMKNASRTMGNASRAMGSASRTMGNASSAFDLVGWLASTRPIVVLSEMVSGVMEETISPRFTLHLLNVQIAGFFALVPAGVDIFLRIICLIWFVTSLCLAKRAYAKM